MLSNKAVVGACSTSKCVGDPSIYKELEYAIKEYVPQIIHFNNGLHGLTTSEEDYACHLEEYVNRVLEWSKTAKLIWASSTPVCKKDCVNEIDPILNSKIVRRNQLSAEIMNRYKIPINDLYSLMVDRPEMRQNDMFHYNAMGSQFIANKIVEVLSCFL